MMLWSITVTSRGHALIWVNIYLSQCRGGVVSQTGLRIDTADEHCRWMCVFIWLYITVVSAGLKSHSPFFLLLLCQVGHRRSVLLEVDVNVYAYRDVE